MGDAEDAVLRELAQKKLTSDQKAARHIQEFVVRLEEILPRVVEHLRAQNYAVDFNRELVIIEGEQRVAWMLDRHWDDRFIYILADGTFVLTGRQGPLTPQALADEIGPSSHLIDRLWQLLHR